MRPVILGVGVPKGGSTWLASMLAAHPRVIVPQAIKEIRYFDLHFHRGDSWYATSFNDSSLPPKLGFDFSPQYLYDPLVLKRVAATPYVRHAIAVIRAPWERAWSEYLHISRMATYNDQFWDVVAKHPEIMNRGKYSAHLRAWRDKLGPQRMHICILEEFAAQPTVMLAELMTRLDLDPNVWQLPSHDQKNQAFVPRSPRLYSFGITLKQKIRSRGWRAPQMLASRLHIRRLLRSDARPQPLPNDLRTELKAQFVTDVEALQTLLGREVPW